MTTTAAILSLLTSVVAFVIWWIKRKADTPETKSDKILRYENEVRRAISNKDGDAVNVLIERRLQNIRSYSSKSGDNSSRKESASANPRLSSSSLAHVGNS